MVFCGELRPGGWADPLLPLTHLSPLPQGCLCQLLEVHRFPQGTHGLVREKGLETKDPDSGLRLLF